MREGFATNHHAVSAAEKKSLATSVLAEMRADALDSNSVANEIPGIGKELVNADNISLR